MKKKMNRKQRRNRAWILVLPLYLTTLVFVLGPMIYMLVMSFMTRHPDYSVGFPLTLDNYKNIVEPVYLSTFGDSLKIGLITTLLVALIGYPCGYFMAKLSATAKKVMMALIMIPFWTSSLTRMYGFMILLQSNGVLDKVLMGVGLTEAPLRLLYSFSAVLSGMVYMLLPFMILSVYSSAEKMDWTLVEAARDLGASAWKAFITVTFKMTLPGLMSGVILTFIPSMGLFFVADILGGNKIVLVGTVIQEQLTKVRNWPFAAALAVVLMLLTSLMIAVYKKVTGTRELEGIV